MKEDKEDAFEHRDLVSWSREQGYALNGTPTPPKEIFDFLIMQRLGGAGAEYFLDGNQKVRFTPTLDDPTKMALSVDGGDWELIGVGIMSYTPGVLASLIIEAAVILEAKNA